ncbi:MAG: hypothetical protein GXO48_09500, partial [Chlorobi bacterium]|nr:hypothetical protein [Chlorobiota bacterium]
MKTTYHYGNPVLGKKSTQLLTLLFLAHTITQISIQAQNVGIGAPIPHPSAKIEIASNNKGILIPRLSLISLSNPAPVSSPAVSLLVFNNGTGGLSPIGFYWWDGTKWKYLIDSVSTLYPLIGDGTQSNPVAITSGNNLGDLLIWDGAQWRIKPAPFDSVCLSVLPNYVQKWT